MTYLDYKKLSNTVAKSGNINAIGYFFQEMPRHINNKIYNYKYTHNDLTKKERKQLHRMNGLKDDDVLIGGEIHRVITKNNRRVLDKVGEIDLFVILEQI